MLNWFKKKPWKSNLKICYHGTSEENAKSILEEGFRYNTWFSTNLQDALAFGGNYVFEVCFDNPPNSWQFMSKPMSVDKIVNLTVYKKEVIKENSELRKKILKNNKDNCEIGSN